MKRSEMITILKEKLDQIKGNLDGEDLYPLDNYLIESLLSEVEKNGMLPPYYRESHNLPGCVDTYNIWEPENN